MSTSDDRSRMGESLRWSLEWAADPSLAAADWLARDIDPACEGAVHLVTCDATPLAHLVAAKDAFKTMRIVGEMPTDRRMAARLYAATIAAALVRHERRISRQSDRALRRALEALVDDTGAPRPLQKLAAAALTRISS